MCAKDEKRENNIMGGGLIDEDQNSLNKQVDYRFFRHSSEDWKNVRY